MQTELCLPSDAQLTQQLKNDKQWKMLWKVSVIRCPVVYSKSRLMFRYASKIDWSKADFKLGRSCKSWIIRQKYMYSPKKPRWWLRDQM